MVLDIKDKEYYIRAGSQLVKRLKDLRNLGNKENKRKFQYWMERETSAQSSFQKQNVCNSGQKLRRRSC